MKPFFDSGSGSAIMNHPVTDDEYQIDCKWSYSFYPATLEEPQELEFETYNHILVLINSKRTLEEIPDWIDWERYNEIIYENEITNG